MKKIMVLATHPDDETLGCGGTLLKHKKNGDKIYWLIATGRKKEDYLYGETISRRDSEIDKVSRAYKFDGIYKLGLPATRLIEVSSKDIINKISAILKKVKPQIIYLPFRKDIHSDHRKLFDAAYSCTKIFRYPFLEKILMMETISETEFASPLKGDVFIPNYFVDITETLNKKLSIMKIYKNEIGSHPFPRSMKNVKALATFRGATSGCVYAESFMLLKEISR